VVRGKGMANVKEAKIDGKGEKLVVFVV